LPPSLLKGCRLFFFFFLCGFSHSPTDGSAGPLSPLSCSGPFFLGPLPSHFLIPEPASRPFGLSCVVLVGCLFWCFPGFPAVLLPFLLNQTSLLEELLCLPLREIVHTSPLFFRQRHFFSPSRVFGRVVEVIVRPAPLPRPVSFERTTSLLVFLFEGTDLAVTRCSSVCRRCFLSSFLSPDVRSRR